MKNDWWKDLIDRLKIAVTILIDCALLALWLIANWGLEYLYHHLELFRIMKVVFLAFHVIFALSTLVAIGIHIYEDIRTMLLRAQRRIQGEMELKKTNDSNSNSGNN